jgi:two-component system alkaline phosphatase synthesis response regulator PhoP
MKGTAQTLLIVEDDPVIAMALEDDLSAEGYGVTVAGDGEAAVRHGKTGAFDGILLDVTLPSGKDGFDVCRDLRRAGVKTPIIMLTARTQEAEKVLGFELGADDYVTKPYSARELRARIKAVLRRVSDAPPDRYAFGEVEVDFDRREVRRAGTAVGLTPLEFKLLAVLVRHRGRALSRQQLIDEAWGKDTFVTDRVVDNQVANLRKKIEPDPASPTYVLNLRGFGYRFDG